MALKKAANKEQKAKQAEDVLKLRRSRKYAIVSVFSILFVLVLTGFVNTEQLSPQWPDGFSDIVPRGKIISRSGVVFAEGLAEHRRYPQDKLAAHIIGFSGKLQSNGRYGLEGLEYSKDADLQAGKNVVITIDPYMQAIAQDFLAKTVEEQKAENGTVVILEAGSGRILASASYPDYDPNKQSQIWDRSVIGNKAFLNLFEPGSVMKPFVVASLLESGKLNLDEEIDTTMTLRVGDKTFRDVAQHPDKLNPWDILRYSSNVGMIHLSSRFSDKELYSWLKHFGFGSSVGLRSAYTRVPNLRAPKWVPQDQASITIGQSVSTTTLQLAALYSIFANDGLYIPPYIVEGEQSDDVRQVISMSTARTMRSMLRYVVSNSSLNHLMPKYSKVGGKTGTADIYDSRSGRYTKGDYTLTFAGMFPIDKPKLVMVVSIQKPRVASSSTYVAAPLFAKIQDGISALWQTPTEVSALATLNDQ